MEVKVCFIYVPLGVAAVAALFAPLAFSAEILIKEAELVASKRTELAPNALYLLVV